MTSSELRPKIARVTQRILWPFPTRPTEARPVPPPVRARTPWPLFAWFAIGAVLTYVGLLMNLTSDTQGSQSQDAAVGIGSIVYVFPAAMVGLVTVVAVSVVRAFRR